MLALKKVVQAIPRETAQLSQNIDLILNKVFGILTKVSPNSHDNIELMHRRLHQTLKLPLNCCKSSKTSTSDSLTDSPLPRTLSHHR